MPTLTNELSADSRSTLKTSGRFTTVCAVLALVAAVYGVYRIDAANDRLDRTRDALLTLETAQSAARAELSSLTARIGQADKELQERLGEIAKLPQRFGELQNSVEELRGRTDRPQRAWTRAEVTFLLELANRRLQLERDPATAIVALQAADAQLAELHETGLVPVRTQLAHEIQALQAVPRPDLADIETRLQRAEHAASRLKVVGTVIGKPPVEEDKPVSDSALGRAWEMIRHAVAKLIVVRRLAGPADTLVTVEQEALRRQQLELLLYAARQSALRRDAPTYQQSIHDALECLGKYFATDDAAVRSLVSDLQPLAQIDIAPPLPDISASRQLLERPLPGQAPG